MGIHSLHKILEQYAPNCYQLKHLSEYSFKKICIDISLYLYKFKASQGDKWLLSFIDLISCLRKWDIHCVYVYDGKATDDKAEEQKRRKESQVKQRQNIELLEKEIENYQTSGVIGEMISDIIKKEGTTSLLKKNKKIDIDIVKEKLEKMKAQSISITPLDIQLTKDLFDILKVPYVVAFDEAERFASIMCVKNITEGVLSEDTDVLAYQTPCFLTKIDIYRETVIEIKISDILEEMGMEYDSFRDLCIMLGCDYNENIASYGPVKSYQLIKEHKSIEKALEQIEKNDIENKEKLQKKLLKEKNPEEQKKIQEKINNNLDVSVINYVRCRELFSVPEIFEYYVPYCSSLTEEDFVKVEDFFKNNNIKYNMKLLRKNLSPRDIIFLDEPETKEQDQ
jgi:5'-3' exonuclease